MDGWLVGRGGGGGREGREGGRKASSGGGREGCQRHPVLDLWQEGMFSLPSSHQLAHWYYEVG